MFRKGAINMNDYLKTKELCHWGIIGQRWGIRRYQNADGTLTAEGKQRYGTVETMERESQESGAAKSAIDSASEGLSKASTLFSSSKGSKAIRKDYSNMSDDELRKKVNRLNLERSYGDLSGDTKYVKTGKEVAHEILQSTAAVLGVVGSAVAIYMSLSGQVQPKKK